MGNGTKRKATRHINKPHTVISLCIKTDCLNLSIFKNLCSYTTVMLPAVRVKRNDNPTEHHLIESDAT